MPRAIDVCEPPEIEVDDPGAERAGSGAREAVLWTALILSLAVLLLGCVHRSPQIQPTPTPTPVVGGPSCGELAQDTARCSLTDDCSRDGKVNRGATYDCPVCCGTATPTPTPMPSPVAMNFPRPFMGTWGIGYRAEKATQVSQLYPRFVHGRFNGGHLLTQAGRASSEEPASVAAGRLTDYARQIQELGDWIVLEMDWTDAAQPGGFEGEITSAPTVDLLLSALAPAWDHVAYILIDDEAGNTAASYSAKAAAYRKAEAAHGLVRKPLASTIVEADLWAKDAQRAPDLQIVMVEAYGAGCGLGSRQANADAITAELTRMRGLIPADKEMGVWLAQYDRNGCWTMSADDLAALLWPTCSWMRSNGVSIGEAFCAVRAGVCAGNCGGGWWDYQPEMVPQQERCIALLRTGNDIGPPVPTPAPTPDHTGDPGTLWIWQNTLTFPAGSSALTFQVYRKDGARGRVGASWRAVCWTPGEACPDMHGTFEMADGMTAVHVSFEVGTSERWRYYHYYVESPTGGALLESYPSTGGNLQILAGDGTWTWEYSPYPGIPGGDVRCHVYKPASAVVDAPSTVQYTITDPHGCAEWYDWEHATPTAVFSAGWNFTTPTRLRVRGDAPSGCEFDLGLVGVPLGSVPTCTIRVP